MHGSQFATYDLIFRYPKDLDLAAPGELVEERTEGDWRITHRRTASTIRVAAFNLGNYARNSGGARRLRGGSVRQPRAGDAACGRRPANSSPLPTGPRLPRRTRATATPMPPDRAAPDPLGTAAKPGRGHRLRHGVHGFEIRTAGAAAPDGFADPGNVRPGLSGPDLSFHAVVSEQAARQRHRAAERPQRNRRAVLPGHVAGSRDRAPVVGQPRGHGQLSRQLADGSAGQLLGFAVPGKDQGTAPGGLGAGQLPRLRCSPRAPAGRRWNRPAPSCSAAAWRARSIRPRGAPSLTAKGPGSCRCCGGAWATSASSPCWPSWRSVTTAREISTEAVPPARRRIPAAEDRTIRNWNRSSTSGFTAPEFRRSN